MYLFAELTGFGGGSTFGTQPQQQGQTNPMFGNSTTSTSGGFDALC